MKKIISGVTYNTDTSTPLGRSNWKPNDATEIEEVLYQTRGGAFFVDVVETKQVWVESWQAMEERVEHAFTPLSPEQAQKWMLEGEEVEVLHNPFEDPPEAAAESEPAATIYIRVPAALKRQVDEAARTAKQSGNVWAMRCVERCLEERSEVARRAFNIHWLATTFLAYDEPDAFSPDQWREALTEIVEQCGQLWEESGQQQPITDEALGHEIDTMNWEKRFQPYQVGEA
ncbi:MAG: hypothetical protein RIM84_21040 [Alphaproteobacteria bacterium]